MTQPSSDAACSSCGRPLIPGTSVCPNCRIRTISVWPPTPTEQGDNSYATPMAGSEHEKKEVDVSKDKQQITTGVLLGFLIYFSTWICLFGWVETVGVESLGTSAWRVALLSGPLFPYLLLIVAGFALGEHYKTFKRGALYGYLAGTAAAIVILYSRRRAR